MSRNGNTLGGYVVPAIPVGQRSSERTLGGYVTGGANNLGAAPSAAQVAVQFGAAGGLNVAARTLVQPTELEAEAILELVAEATLQQEQVAAITANALLELVADSRVEVEYRITAETLLEPVSTLAIEQEHRIEVEALLELVADAAIQTAFDGVYDLSGRFEVGVNLLHAGALHDRVAAGRFEAGMTFLPSLGYSFRLLAGRFEAGVQLRDNYVGRGTGLVHEIETTTAFRRFLEGLREGDEFPVYLPWGGLDGKTGIARIVSRRLSDEHDLPDFEIQFIEQAEPELITRLAEDSLIPFVPKTSGNLFRSVANLKRRRRNDDNG